MKRPPWAEIAKGRSEKFQRESFWIISKTLERRLLGSIGNYRQGGEAYSKVGPD